ncbi:uncharacterized protein LOC135397019 [Ornithodoros turicata]|uniref:uncharacterized protein LOC135397019 n=1 Tax=Ornithodoros turicata TaxID=34597 RepID=UPI003139601C
MSIFILTLLVASGLVTTSSFASGTKYSQRYDGTSSRYEWNPSLPPSRTRSNRNARQDNLSSWHNKDTQPVAEASRRSFSVKPDTITATITLPRSGASKTPSLPPPEPLPEPEDISVDPIADPQTDPPIYEAPYVDSVEPVVRTTLLTPLSHGYIVAFVRKSLLSRLNGDHPNGQVVNLTPKSSFQLKKSEEPAFLMYIPPDQTRTFGDAQYSLRDGRRTRTRLSRHNRQRDDRAPGHRHLSLDYDDNIHDGDELSDRRRMRQLGLRARRPQRESPRNAFVNGNEVLLEERLIPGLNGPGMLTYLPKNPLSSSSFPVGPAQIAPNTFLMLDPRESQRNVFAPGPANLFETPSPRKPLFPGLLPFEGLRPVL